MTIFLWVILLYFIILPVFAISLVVIVKELSYIGNKNHSISKRTLLLSIIIFITAFAASPPVLFKTIIANEGKKYIETGQTANYIVADYDNGDSDLINRIKFNHIIYEDFYQKLEDASFIFEELTVEETSPNVDRPIANLIGADIDYNQPTELEKLLSKYYGMHTNFDLIYSTKNENLEHCIFYISMSEIDLYCDQEYTQTLIEYYLDYSNYNFYLTYYSEGSPEGEKKIDLKSDSNRLIWDISLNGDPINFNYDDQVRDAFPNVQVKTLNYSDDSIIMNIIAESKDSVIGKHIAEIYIEDDKAYQVLGHYNDGSDNSDIIKAYVLPLPDDIEQSILAQI